jgi:hypothetical protein
MAKCVAAGGRSITGQLHEATGRRAGGAASRNADSVTLCLGTETYNGDELQPRPENWAQAKVADFFCKCLYAQQIDDVYY